MRNKTILVTLKYFKGELNPFDASALECALNLGAKQVIALAMAPLSVEQQLKDITRLGVRCVLVSDKCFAGSDTIVTSNILASAIKRIEPDIIFCGRQSVDGDTAQVPPMVAKRLGFDIKTKVISCSQTSCTLRSGESIEFKEKTIYTFEKIYTLRFPSIFSKVSQVEILSNNDLNFNEDNVGLKGSPTRVVNSYESNVGRRFCTLIQKEELRQTIIKALSIKREQAKIQSSQEKLDNVYYVGNVEHVAKSVGENPIKLDVNGKTVEQVAEFIKEKGIKVVLWQDDEALKVFAPQVATLLGAGMCADCISFSVKNGALVMTRPAQGGTLTADIVCDSEVAFAIVRTVKEKESQIIFTIGQGAIEHADKIKQLASEFDAEICASRRVVDSGKMPYEKQVGLTGKVVSPKVYVAFGVSGAVQHTSAIENAGVIIAVNFDRSARIFDYADYGIVCDVKDIT